MSSGTLKLARAGYLLIAIAIVFFLVAMFYLAPKSTDPVELMRVAGQASGVAGALGILLVILDFVRRKKA